MTDASLPVGIGLSIVDETVASGLGLLKFPSALETAFESETGRRIKGRVRLTECIHPEGIGVAALANHWSKGLPVAKGKGVFFNDLLELTWDHVSPVNLGLDVCAKVKVIKIVGEP